MRRVLPVILFVSLAGCGVQAQTISNKNVSNQTSDATPSLTAMNGRVYIAWLGKGNTQMNVMLTSDLGRSYSSHITSSASGYGPPSVANFSGRLFLAFRGMDSHLNVQKILLDSSGNPHSFGSKVTSAESSDSPPMLISTGSALLITWRGKGGGELNVAQVAIR